MVFQSIYNSRFTKIVIIFLCVLTIFFSFDFYTAEPVRAEPITLLTGFAALVGVVLTAIVGYSLTSEYQLTFGQISTLYDSVLNKLSTNDQASFIAALGTFMTNGGIITQNLIDQLQIGLIGNEVIETVKANYTNVIGNFSEADYTAIENALINFKPQYNTNRLGSSDIFYFNLNSRYLIGYQFVPLRDYIDMTGSYKINNIGLEHLSSTSLRIRNNIMKQIHLSVSYVYSEVYTNLIIYDTSNSQLVYENTVSKLYLSNLTDQAELVGITTDFYKDFSSIPFEAILPQYGYLPTFPGIQDLDLGTTTIPVPTDVAVSIPAFPIDPGIDTPITIPIPPAVSGENVIDIPVDPVGTANPIDPTVPDVGTLDPTATGFLQNLFDYIFQFLKWLFVPSDTYFIDVFTGFQSDMQNKLGYDPSQLTVFQNMSGNQIPDITLNGTLFGRSYSAKILDTSRTWNEYAAHFRAIIVGALAIFLIFHNMNEIYFLIRGTRPFKLGKGEE